MKINTAIKILKDRAEFYRATMDDLVSTLDDELEAWHFINEPVKIVEAYKVYKNQSRAKTMEGGLT